MFSNIKNTNIINALIINTNASKYSLSERFFIKEKPFLNLFSLKNNDISAKEIIKYMHDTSTVYMGFIELRLTNDESIATSIADI